MIPQIIIVALYAAALTLAAAKNGQSRGVYDVKYTFIGLVIQLGLLYWAGTFDCFFK